MITEGAGGGPGPDFVVPGCHDARMDDDKKELRAEALALREAGRTRDQIRHELGLKSDWALTELLDREPPRHPGLRARAKDELRQRARALRMAGNTYPDIAAKLGVAKSSVSLWASELPSVPKSPEGQERRTEAVRAAARKRREEIEAAKEEFRRTALDQIGAVTERDLMLIGAVAYWCEGTKSKPWNRTERVIFINSDPGLIRLFMSFLETAGIERERIGLRVSIHESADVARAEAFWADIVGTEAGVFHRASLKRHNPKTVRKNVNDDYHGCLVITVAKSAELYRKIEIWAQIAMLGGSEGR